MINQADTQKSHQRIQTSLLKIAYASVESELVDRLTEEEVPELDGDHLLSKTLDRIDAADDPTITYLHFAMKALLIAGFGPELHVCVNCQAEIVPEDQFFSAQHGGAACKKCGPFLDGTRAISLEALNYLRHIQRSTYERLAGSQLFAPDLAAAENYIYFYLDYVLERQLNSYAFLMKIRNDQIIHLALTAIRQISGKNESRR